jgi:hypothetical protein
VNALTIDIPPRANTLALAGNLAEITHRTALPAVLFSQRLNGITIPVFPAILTDDWVTMNGEFVTMNGERITM